MHLLACVHQKQLQREAGEGAENQGQRRAEGGGIEFWIPGLAAGFNYIGSSYSGMPLRESLWPAANARGGAGTGGEKQHVVRRRVLFRGTA